MRYRKKPVVIEAFQWFGDEAQIEDPVWIITAIKKGEVSFSNRVDGYCSMLIHTLEGTMTASRGDWVIRGVKNELYPCKPEIFEATYELA